MSKLMIFGRGTNSGWSSPIKEYEVTEGPEYVTTRGPVKFTDKDGNEIVTNMDFILEREK